MPYGMGDAQRKGWRFSGFIGGGVDWEARLTIALFSIGYLCGVAAYDRG